MVTDMKSIGLSRAAVKKIADFVAANPSEAGFEQDHLRLILDTNGDNIFVILPGNKMLSVKRFTQ